jgi:hypothetical protein
MENNKEKVETLMIRYLNHLMTRFCLYLPIDSKTKKQYLLEYIRLNPSTFKLIKYAFQGRTYDEHNAIKYDVETLHGRHRIGIEKPLIQYSSNDTKDRLICDLFRFITSKQCDLCDNIFKDFSIDVARNASNNSKNKDATSSINLVYGEVGFTSLSHILEFIFSKDVWEPSKSKNNLTFYDLGSGSGRGVFTTSLLHNFKVCRGIELLDGLFDVSSSVLHKHVHSKESQPIIKDHPKFKNNYTSSSFYGSRSPLIEFINGDLTKIDWSDGDIVFANSTCFDEPLMKYISETCDQCKVGTFIITLTKPCVNPNLKQILTESSMHSWGFATLHIRQKIK